MKRGYFALWRRFQDHKFWREKRRFSKAEAWIDILINTQWRHEPQEILFGMTILIQNYGENLKSIRTWGSRWRWSVSKTYRYLNLLKKMNQIRMIDEKITTRMIIVNYEQYDPRAQESKGSEGIEQSKKSHDLPTSRESRAYEESENYENGPRNTARHGGSGFTHKSGTPAEQGESPVDQNESYFGNESTHKRNTSTHGGNGFTAESGTQRKHERNTSGTRAEHDRDTNKKDKKDKKGKKDKREKTAYPVWLDLEVWNEFKKYRNHGKTKLTDYAQKLAIEKLEKLKKGGHDPTEVMQQTILNGWSGLFPISQKGKSKREVEEWKEKA